LFCGMDNLGELVTGLGDGVFLGHDSLL